MKWFNIKFLSFSSNINSKIVQENEIIIWKKLMIVKNNKMKKTVILVNNLAIETAETDY